MHNEHEYEEGKQIKFRCQSCNEITLHNMIDEDDENSEISIQCVICEETQDYSPRKYLKKATAEDRKKVANSKPENKEKCGMADFKKLLAKKDVSAAIKYETTGAYKIDDIINHQVFGIGFVRRTIFSNKIEVLFSEGCKLLICAPRSEPNLPLAAFSQTKKTNSHKSRNPSSWQPWSSNSEEKREQKFSWGDDESPDQFGADN